VIGEWQVFAHAATHRSPLATRHSDEMRDLFRFLFRQRDNLLFLLLLVIGLSMAIRGNMHQRAEWISSSNAAVARVYSWRNGVMEFADLRSNNLALNVALAREREEALSVVTRRDSGMVYQDTVRQLRYRFLPAQVINSTVHKAKNYLTLDKGTLDGVDRNMGVVGANGIIGVVREASPHFASVISVLNEDHMASAQLKNTKHFGLLRWNTGDPHTVSLADIDKHVLVQSGDTVVTRGSEGVYPPGIQIGVVESVTADQSIPFHVITVRLSEDLTRSDHVQVVTDLMKAERDSLEATAPQE
jgi:rod shape-determining protein MreC